MNTEIPEKKYSVLVDIYCQALASFDHTQRGKNM